MPTNYVPGTTLTPQQRRDQLLQRMTEQQRLGNWVRVRELQGMISNVQRDPSFTSTVAAVTPGWNSPNSPVGAVPPIPGYGTAVAPTTGPSGAAPITATATSVPASQGPNYGALRQAELQAMRDFMAAKYGLEFATTRTQRAQSEEDLGFANLGAQRGVEASRRDLEAGYGGRDTLRSGMYQQATAVDEEEHERARQQVASEYQRELDRLQLELTQGIANRRDAEIAAEAARIKAAYAMAQLG
jgi:hypothetical protein